MHVETLISEEVMKPIGPYSHVAKAGPLIFVSAMAGVDPLTDQLAGPDTYSQARQILRSFRSILERVGASMEQVLHVHVYLLDMRDFEELNRAYREEFRAHRPARTVVGVSALPKRGALLTMSLNAFSATSGV